MKLYKLDHESIVRASDGSFLFDKRLSFFVVVTVLKNYVGDDESHRS